MWTPTTEYIRDSYDEVNRPFVRYSEEEFDRWLAAHDREVAEKAWDEGFMRANRLVNCRMCRGEQLCPRLTHIRCENVAG